ncbi:MAG: hypothetical protein EOP86_26555, partial [Verrucomicrobiaceae bacterium]
MRLTRGLHALKLRSAGGSFAVTNLAVTQTGAPAAPVLTSAVEGDSRVTLTWSGAGEETVHRIRYGTAAGRYDQEIPVGTASTWTVTGLVNGTTYHFAIVAGDAQALSLPSNERGAVPIGPGGITRLANWEFTGLSGAAGVDVSAAPRSASGNAITGLLSRGPGLSVGYYLGIPNTFASGPAESQDEYYGQTLGEAQARGQYYTFTITAAPGKTLTLTQLQFRPYFQSLDEAAARVSYSTDNTNFITAPAPTGTLVAGPGQGALLTVDLSSIAALQSATAPITFRLYLFGVSRYVTTGLGGPGDDLTLFGSYGKPPTSFDAWREMHGLPLDGSGELGNPSGDGVTNLVKFALNLAPAAGDLTRSRARTLANPEGTTVGELTGLPFARLGTDGHLHFIFL